MLKLIIRELKSNQTQVTTYNRLNYIKRLDILKIYNINCLFFEDANFVYKTNNYILN